MPDAGNQVMLRSALRVRGLCSFLLSRPLFECLGPYRAESVDRSDRDSSSKIGYD